MLNIKTFQCNPIQENCFVVSDADSGDAAVIDCGAYYDAERAAIPEYIRKQGLQLRHVLCTHAHFDHIFGVDTLYQEFGLQPRLHDADRQLYQDMSRQLQSMMGMPWQRPLPPLGTPLTHGEVISLGRHSLQVLHTPGHSPGSVVFYSADAHLLFAGDTLFRMSVGRTDLPGGSWQQLMDSLHQVLAPLPADVTVYCGHGPATRMADELAMNPYFR